VVSNPPDLGFTYFISETPLDVSPHITCDSRTFNCQLGRLETCPYATT